jgi:hypothetical protein
MVHYQPLRKIGCPTLFKELRLSYALVYKAVKDSVLEHKRFCYACNEERIWPTTLRWLCNRGTNLDICGRCYARLYYDDKARQRRRENQRKPQAREWRRRRAAYQNRIRFDPYTPRIDICNLCRAVYPFDCKRTEMHHEQYDDKHPERFTIELCPRCHKNRSLELGQMKRSELGTFVVPISDC